MHPQSIPSGSAPASNGRGLVQFLVGALCGGFVTASWIFVAFVFWKVIL